HFKTKQKLIKQQEITAMTEQPTEKCGACDQTIVPPTDDITEQDYKEYKKTSYCKRCREHPDRKKLFENLKNENDAKKIYEEIKEKEQRLAIPLSEYIPEEMNRYVEKLFKEENTYGQIVERQKLILNDFANCIVDNQKHRTFTDSETKITYYWSEKTKTYQTNGELYLSVCAKKLLRERATPAQIKAITELIQYEPFREILNQVK
ncbi:MAG: hypothetical protein LBE70_04455, partial [Nitrososphaerota archaeon]|nr:hypothetical protein [Nitrososphaerota archaeon]